MELRILCDRTAAAVVDKKQLASQIKRVLPKVETTFYGVDDKYGSYQVGGAVNPRAILQEYEDRTPDPNLLRLVLTGYDLRPVDQSFTFDASRPHAVSVVSTHRLQGSQLLVAVMSTHALLHQAGRVAAGSPQLDPRNPHHCRNSRCLMRPIDNVGTLRRVADDWQQRDIILCGPCRGKK